MRRTDGFLRVSTLAATVTLVAALALPALAQDADPRSEAERAYREDRYDDAIEIYRSIVVESPDDLFSARRLALLLSWTDRLDESVAESRRILERHPDDVEARVRLADVLSWQDRYAESRKNYLEVIRRDWKNADAAIGLGNLALWTGDLYGAERWYGRALDRAPGDPRARVGLARVRRAQGRNGAALRELDAVQADRPNDRDATRLREEMDADLRPSISASFTRFLDTDDNDLNLGRLWGTWLFTPDVRGTATWQHHAATSDCTLTGTCLGAGAGKPELGERFETDADTLRLDVAARVAPTWSVGGGAGAVRRNLYDGGATTEAVGGVWGAWEPDESFSLSASADREAILETAILIENEISFDTLSTAATWSPADRWILRARVGHSWISDDNARDSAWFSADYVIPLAHPRLMIGLSSRWLGYDANPEDGYFAPESLWTNLFNASARDSYLDKRLYWSVEASLGVQNVRLHPTPGDTGDRGTDTVFGWLVLGGWNATDRIALEAWFGRTDMAQQSATGFEQDQYGFLARIRL